jgi:hypothetical protein
MNFSALGFDSTTLLISARCEADSEVTDPENALRVLCVALV